MLQIQLQRHFFVCVKRINALQFSCLCSSSLSSLDVANVIRNIGSLGAKNYFTNHGTAKTKHGFWDSFPVLKIHSYSQDMQKFEQPSIPIQVIQGKTVSRYKQRTSNNFETLQTVCTYSNCIINNYYIADKCLNQYLL